MTKKAEAIYNTYCDKLETEKLLYTTNFIKFEELQSRFNKIEDDFRNMIVQMFNYSLLSSKDFQELYKLAYPAHCKIIDNILAVS